jgi:hypothetical protein
MLPGSIMYSVSRSMIEALHEQMFCRYRAAPGPGRRPCPSLRPHPVRPGRRGPPGAPRPFLFSTHFGPAFPLALPGFRHPPPPPSRRRRPPPPPPPRCRHPRVLWSRMPPDPDPVEAPTAGRRTAARHPADRDLDGDAAAVVCLVSASPGVRIAVPPTAPVAGLIVRPAGTAVRWRSGRRSGIVLPPLSLVPDAVLVQVLGVLIPHIRYRERLHALGGSGRAGPGRRLRTHVDRVDAEEPGEPRGHAGPSDVGPDGGAVQIDRDRDVLGRDRYWPRISLLVAKFMARSTATLRALSCWYSRKALAPARAAASAARWASERALKRAPISIPRASSAASAAMVSATITVTEPRSSDAQAAPAGGPVPSEPEFRLRLTSSWDRPPFSGLCPAGRNTQRIAGRWRQPPVPLPGLRLARGQGGAWSMGTTIRGLTMTRSSVTSWRSDLVRKRAPRIGMSPRYRQLPDVLLHRPVHQAGDGEVLSLPELDLRVAARRVRMVGIWNPAITGHRRSRATRPPARWRG